MTSKQVKAAFRARPGPKPPTRAQRAQWAREEELAKGKARKEALAKRKQQEKQAKRKAQREEVEMKLAAGIPLTPAEASASQLRLPDVWSTRERQSSDAYQQAPVDLPSSLPSPSALLAGFGRKCREDSASAGSSIVDADSRKNGENHGAVNRNDHCHEMTAPEKSKWSPDTGSPSWTGGSSVWGCNEDGGSVVDAESNPLGEAHCLRIPSTPRARPLDLADLFERETETSIRDLPYIQVPHSTPPPPEHPPLQRPDSLPAVIDEETPDWADILPDDAEVAQELGVVECLAGISTQDLALTDEDFG